MRALVSAELLKLRTTRTAFGYLVAIVLLTLAVGAVSFATGDFQTETDVESALSVGGVGAALLLILGIVGTTGEYRHGTITSSLLVTPERSRFLAGKVVAYLITGAVLGAVAMAVGYAVGIPWLSARDAPLELLGAGDYLGLALRNVLLAALSGAIGVAVGAIVRNQVAAVVGILVYLFMLEPLVTVLSTDVGAYTMGSAQTSLGSPETEDLLDPLLGGLVLAGWALLLAAAGAWVEERRDVT